VEELADIAVVVAEEFDALDTNCRLHLIGFRYLPLSCFD